MTPTEIKKLRQRLGWTQGDLGQRLHVSPMTVSRWERGRRRPDEYRRAALRQIRGRLNEAESQRQQKQFVNALTAVAVGGGIGLVLGHLFAGGAIEDEHTNDGKSE